MLGRLKTMFGSAPGGLGASVRPPSPRSVTFPEPYSRPSNALEQFFASLQGRDGVNLIDFAGASQANITFITSLRYGLASEDFSKALEQTFGADDPYDMQSDPQLVDRFLLENVNFRPDSYEGALVWDGLQFLTPHVQQVLVDRLFDALRPGSYLFALFPSDEKARPTAVYDYRIADHKTVLLTPRGMRPQRHFFNNRALEKLFHRYSSVKFFLTRDHLREVLVKR